MPAAVVVQFERKARFMSQPAPHKHEISCTSCNLRELCLPGGVCIEDLEQVQNIVYARRRIKRGESIFGTGDEFTAIYAIRSGFFKTSVVDGPFTETKELIAGYTIIQAKSREEAIEWTKRFPNPSLDGMEAEIEVREFYELEDFAQSSEVERFRKMETERKAGRK